ncbi:hypothetical protein [Sphingomonas sp. M1-B02]|uniref:hypothetical protein n=1 Tax=Sphingomonas sp. M1-B02 TaxID=3114300 RepID=UPI002240870B|nr:hypothetical protein [Sphingomonas sp. S6-11]UZK64848.1 hypothetical protein OKW87_09915 [Sphingomonas sp. S6-11]
MSNRDLEYYEQRLRQEREHAARADDSSARRVHLELAEHYSAKLRDPMKMPAIAQA